MGEIINNRLTLLLLIFAFILPYGLNAYSNSIKLSNPDFNWEYQYNFYRSSISDYQIPLYEGNEEFYNSIDINSQNDLNYFTSWNGDKEFFTVEKLKIITDYAKEIGCKTADPTYITKVIVNKFIEITEKFGLIFVCALVVFLAFVIYFIVYFYKNKNKLKRYFLTFSVLFNFIPIFALSLLCKALDIIPMSALVILIGYIIVTMFVTIFFEKVISLKMVFFSATTIILMVYLSLSRINFRSLYSVIIPMFFVILYQIDFKKLNSFGKKLCQKNTLKVLVYSLFLCVSLIMSISLMAQFNVYERNEKANDYSLYNYMQNNKDNFYVVASEVDIAIRTNYDNPFLIPEQPDNVVLLGGWLSTNIYEIKKAEKYDVKWICKDLIEKENVYLVVSKKTTNTLQSLIGQYINDHYANENETINFNIIKTFGNNCICEVFKS